MEQIFKNKVALVTGGSFGIGRATPIAFARRGAKVVIADWLEDKETLAAIQSGGGEAIFVKCDVSKDVDVKNLVDKTVSQLGRLDFAFNNAGIEGVSAPTHHCSEENWDKTIGVNLKGVWLCLKYEITTMLQTGGGAIVNNASRAGRLYKYPRLCCIQTRRNRSHEKRSP